MNLRPILLIEDNADDAYFMQKAFEAAGVANPVTVMTDGEEAIEYLSGPDVTDDLKRPCVTLLDLKLPYRNGFDVLAHVRAQAATRLLPVVVLTSSNEPSDINRAHELGANAYVVKPSAFNELNRVVEAIRDFWLGCNHPAS